MPIRLKPIDSTRVEIDPTFIDAMTKVRSGHMTQLALRIREAQTEIAQDYLGPWDRKVKTREIKDWTSELQMMQRQENGIMGGRAGLDYDITRLHKLPYLGLTTLERHNRDGIKQHWLIGKTGNIISEPIYHHKRQDPAEHGPYLACVDLLSLGQNNVVWSLLDLSDIMATQPHLHVRTSYYFGDEEEKPSNPLDWDQSTCWAEFGGIIQSLWLSADIPEIFQILHQFISSLNMDSPLGSSPISRWRIPGTTERWPRP